MTLQYTPFAARNHAQHTKNGDSVKIYRLSQVRRRSLSLLTVLAVIWGVLVLAPQPVAAQGFKIFVPAVGNNAGPGGVGTEPDECALNSQEVAIERMMLSHPQQGRDNPVCDPILAQVARARARDMALRGYFSHTNPDGDGPNILVREAGYRLPDWYSHDQDANNIESIGGGYGTAEDAFQGWMNSNFHRTHVLATNDFYSDQDSYGIGYFFNEDSQYGHYWVFISAPTAD